MDGRTVGDGTCNMIITLCHHEDGRIDTRQTAVAAISPVDAGLPSGPEIVEFAQGICLESTGISLRSGAKNRS